MSRIPQLFANKSEKVIPFITAGYPKLTDTVEMVLAAEAAGAAMIELGMPFSDPLADGPIIQASSKMAIENGVTLEWILNTVDEIRRQSDIPLILMGYFNPILKYGLIPFIKKCEEVGVDGLIIPDLPPEEADEYVCLSKENQISPILLVAPNTADKRISEISTMAGDLIYCVAILGLTGSNVVSEGNLTTYLNRVKEFSSCPFVVGFGISQREDVVSINMMSDGAVVGSAIIKEIEKNDNPSNAVMNYIKKLRGNND